MTLFKILKGYADYCTDLIEPIYRCCLCGLCETWCQAGCSIPDLILQARREIVNRDQAPTAVAQIRENIHAHGNPFGLSAKQRFIAIDIPANTVDHPEVLYYVGCETAYRRPEIANALIGILHAASIQFTLLSDEHTTGKPLSLLGYKDDACVIAQSLLDKIRATGCKTLVTTCPSSFDAFTVDYPAMGLDMTGIEVVHSTSYLNRLATENQIAFRSVENLNVTYLDDGYLGRRHKLFDQPRRLLRQVANLTLREMVWSRELALSCGEAGGVFRLLYPKQSGKMARRVLDEAARTNIDILVTSCPVIKDILVTENHPSVQVREITELLVPV